MSKVVVLGAAHPHVFDMAAAVAGAEGAELVGVWDEDASRRGAAGSPPPGVKNLGGKIFYKDSNKSFMEILCR